MPAATAAAIAVVVPIYLEHLFLYFISILIFVILFLCEISFQKWNNIFN